MKGPLDKVLNPWKHAAATSDIDIPDLPEVPEGEVRKRHSDGYDPMRDRVFNPPSSLSQLWICCTTQMKRYTKEKTVWFLLVLLALIPIVSIYEDLGKDNVANLAMASILVMMPVIMVFICTQVCGSALPREFNERTAYLSLPLPITRMSFYFGKFLAGFLLCAGIIIAAYGIAALFAIMGGGALYTSAMFESIVMAMCATLFYCSFTYMLSAGSKRGAGMMSLIVLLIAIPILPMIVLRATEAMQMTDLGNMLLGYFAYLPVYSPDMAVYTLGVPAIEGASGFAMSVQGLGVFMSSLGMPGPVLCTQPVVMMLICLGCSVLCLLSGYRKISRRDM